jgi:predicted amidophosphoribosyltransferase
VWFERRCAGCDEVGASPCAACIARFQPPPDAPCPTGLVACDSLFAYEGRGRTVVVSLKYRNRRDAAAVLGRGMAALVDRSEVDVVTWAPTTRSRRARRGYDQSRLLALAVAHALARPCRRLLRRAGGVAQTGRALDDRLIGPSFAVVATPSARVLVVDDVVTSGATLSAAACALHMAGARTVRGVTAARTPLKVALASVEKEDRHDPPIGLGRSTHPHEVRPRMQVTELQVQRSLQALSESPAAPTTTSKAAADEVPAGLVEQLAGAPSVRDDRLAEARERLETGEQPTADDLAGRMVGRLVCDRLR